MIDNKDLFQEIFSRPELKEKPPVIIDIGASYGIHPIWEPFAAYAKCIAFDADDREFSFEEKDDEGFLKLYRFPCLAGVEDIEAQDFYLTASPYCSSTLMPDNAEMKKWDFGEMFDVKEKITARSRNVQNVINELDLDYVDWVKTDSQGIDLRLFKSLNDDIIQNILVADFEPGIMDAYKGEDKLYSILAYMNDKPFWMSGLKVFGPKRISKETINEIPQNWTLDHSPGWAEATFVNNLVEADMRSFLLGWVFSTILGQHGFAYEKAKEGQQKFGDSIFDKLIAASKSNMYPKYSLKFRVKRKLQAILNNW